MSVIMGHANTESVGPKVSELRKDSEHWDTAQFLVSIGMSEEEANEWVKARKKGRPLMQDPSDELGKHLDLMLERYMKNIYVDKSAWDDAIVRSHLEALKLRLM
jgi:predicted transcriptional regulator